MFPIRFDDDIFIPMLVFAIPIIAVTGGIVLGLVRTLGRQRMVELAQRERIAAIERGIDPAKLPPVDLGRTEYGWGDFSGSSPLRRAQGLLIGGLVTLFAGTGLVAFLVLLKPDSNQPVWAVGLIPAFVGVALLLSARIVWPKGPNGSNGAR